jgi:tripartite-type tricarboxylate transporter receptor subunit TctC
MKKRLICTLLALTMLFALAACGGSEESSAPESTAPESTAPEGENNEAAIWPTETVTVYVPAAAGSTLDLVCRVQTDYLTRTTGQNFVVVDDETGNGSVVYETCRNAPTDGTVLMYTQNIFLQYYGSVYNEYPFDVVDAVAAGGDSDVAYALCIAADRPYTTWEELVDYAKEHPGEVVCGIQNGGMAHLMSAILCQQAGIDVKMVESGGSTEKVTNMMGGMVDFAMISSPTAAPYEESGDLIVVASTTPERSSAYPDWPTTAELGYPDVISLSHACWFVPKNMDESLKTAINEAFANMADDETVSESLAALGYYYNYMTIDETVDLLLADAESLKDGYELSGVSMANKK